MGVHLRTSGGELGLHLLRVLAALHRRLHRDQAGRHEAGQVHLDGLHAFGGTGGDHVAHLARLAFAHQVADRLVGDHHLVRSHATAADGRHQTLGDDALQGTGEHDLDLVTTLGGEHVDDAVERLGGVVGVQRGEHQVTGLGE